MIIASYICAVEWLIPVLLGITGAIFNELETQILVLKA